MMYNLSLLRVIYSDAVCTSYIGCLPDYTKNTLGVRGVEGDVFSAIFFTQNNYGSEKFIFPHRDSYSGLAHFAALRVTFCIVVTIYYYYYYYYYYTTTTCV